MSSRTACVVTGAFLILLASSQFTRAQNQASQPTLEQELKETEAGCRKSDAAMNELYQKLLSSLPPNEQEEFKNSQRAWVKSRNHFAATAETMTESYVSILADHDVAIPDPRAADDILLFRFLKRKTEDRIEELKNYIPPKAQYPPAGYQNIQEVKSPTAEFVIKEFDKPSAPNPNGPGAQWETAGSKQAWVVSETDPLDHHELPFYRDETGVNCNDAYEKASYQISPDSKWVFREQQDEFLHGSAYLYRRRNGTLFEKATAKPLSDLAWQFFAHTVKKVSRDDLDHYEVRFDSWRENVKKLRVVLSGPEKRSWIIADWVCDYDLEKGKFEVPSGFQQRNAKAVKDISKE